MALVCDFQTECLCFVASPRAVRILTFTFNFLTFILTFFRKEIVRDFVAVIITNYPQQLRRDVDEKNGIALGHSYSCAVRASLIADRTGIIVVK